MTGLQVNKAHQALLQAQMLLILGDAALERRDSERALDLLGHAWEAVRTIPFQNDPHLIVISLVSFSQSSPLRTMSNLFGRFLAGILASLLQQFNSIFKDASNRSKITVIQHWSRIQRRPSDDILLRCP